MLYVRDFFWKSYNNSIKYQIRNMGNELDTDLISGACPESISDHPKLALGWLSHIYFWNVTLSLSNIFSNGAHNVRPLELRPQGKSNFRWSSPTSFFCKKAFPHGFLPRCSRFVKGTPLSHFKAFLDLFYRDFVPHVGSHPIAYILGFPTFVGRRRKNARNLSSPILQRAQG